MLFNKFNKLRHYSLNNKLLKNLFFRKKWFEAKMKKWRSFMEEFDDSDLPYF